MLVFHLNALVIPTFVNPYYGNTKTVNRISIRATIQTHGSYINRMDGCKVVSECQKQEKQADLCVKLGAIGLSAAALFGQ